MLLRMFATIAGTALSLLPSSAAESCRTPEDDYSVKITPNGDMVRPDGDWANISEQSIIDLFTSACDNACGEILPSTNFIVAQKSGDGTGIYAVLRCQCVTGDVSKAVFADQLRWLQWEKDC